MDFVSDTLGDGRSFRTFTLVHDCSRESPGLLIDVSIGAAQITKFLDTLPVLPRTLVCDNGPEFTSRHFAPWAHARGITMQFIQPGNRFRTCYIEGFNDRLRDECLNESWFVNIADAELTIEAWIEYSVARPHTGLVNRNPGGVYEDLREQSSADLPSDARSASAPSLSTLPIEQHFTSFRSGPPPLYTARSVRIAGPRTGVTSKGVHLHARYAHQRGPRALIRRD